MIYLIIFLAVILVGFAVLIFLRKLQFDAVHNNFLDIVDRYGGKVVRGGFAVRPRYTGSYRNNNVSISISAEKREKNKPRQFFISLFYQSAANANFTVMAKDWLKLQNGKNQKNRIFKNVGNEKYVLEVTEKELMNQLDIPGIEEQVLKLDPFAYVLVSKKGILLERLSTNLIADTEFRHMEVLLDGVYELSRLNEKKPL
ncbi:MAG: hypothetical protein WAN36_05215 [Calditrichia bacterium]